MRTGLFLLGAVVGACSTAAVSSSASAPTEPARPEAAASPGEGPRYVVPLADAERRQAPNGKGAVTILARGDNAFVARLQLPAGGAVPLHRDATEEYIHVLSGGGTITIEGIAYEIAEGATVYMPANVEVSYQNGDAPLVAIQVFAGPEPAAKYDAWSVVDGQ